PMVGSRRARGSPWLSGPAGAGYFDLDGADAAVAGAFDLRGVRRDRFEQVEGFAVGAAEHAGDGAELRSGDAGGDLAARAHAQEGGVRGTGVGHPDGAFGVETDPVRGSVERRPDAAVVERTVGSDVEGGEAIAARLTDDQRPTIWGDHGAVGDGEIAGG